MLLICLELILDSSALRRQPDLINFSNLVISHIPAKWQLFGIQLGFSKDDMDRIEQDCQGANHSQKCFIAVFNEWEKQSGGSQNIKEFTWSTVVKILSRRFLCESRVANAVYTYCHKQ